jgi:hypothetical protein
MSDYNLAQLGVITATASDGAGPKDATLASTIKPASSFITSSIRTNRKQATASVQRGTLALTNADSSPKDVTLGTAVDMSATFVTFSYKDNRGTTPTVRGVTGYLTSTTNLRFEFAALGAAETLDIAWEVVEKKPEIIRGATVRILDGDTVRLEWDGTLAGTETIVASYDVWDLENFGDDMKEALFRLTRVLGYLGENAVQDLITYDNAGNVTQFRVRSFDSKTNAEAATVDLPDGQPLQTGEYSRVTFQQSIDVSKNDRTLLKKVLTDLLATPGVN